MNCNILFTGYAPVHFVCFRPIFQKLLAIPQCRVYVSGGLKTKNDSEMHYDTAGLYRNFNIPTENILSMEEIAEREFDVLFSAHTKLILPKKAHVRIQIFHGISFRNKAIRQENLGCDYYFIVGPYMRRKFIENGFMKGDDPRALSIGFAKTDSLLNGTLNKEELIKKYRISGTRPILLYAPTGQKHNSLEIMGKNLISHIVDSNKFDLLIKLHDHPKKVIDWHQIFSSMENDHFRIVDKEYDVSPLMFLADLLITDASSVSNEYSLLQRPMIFIDVPKLLAKEKKRGAQVDLESWGRKGGILIKEPEEIVDAISHSLENPGRFRHIQQQMVQDLFYNPGKASEAAVQWLRQHFSF